jgi:dolichol-phosphate mannosyltransferase
MLQSSGTQISMKTIIVIPTYNEAKNVEPLIRAIFSNAPQVFVMIVDDNSPDGTGGIVKGLLSSFPQLMLYERTEKQGLGVAYRAGFRRALELHPDTEVLGMMDADFYHDPKDLPKLLEAVKTYDMVIGSVYAPGGKVPDSFTVWRHILSRGGNLYCRILFGYPLTDWTNAFVAIHVSALKKIDLDTLAAREFAFVFGIKYTLLKSGATWKDIGVVAADRTEGESKIRLKTIIEALIVPWKLRFGKHA